MSGTEYPVLFSRAQSEAAHAADSAYLKSIAPPPFEFKAIPEPPRPSDQESWDGEQTGPEKSIAVDPTLVKPLTPDRPRGIHELGDKLSKQSDTRFRVWGTRAATADDMAMLECSQQVGGIISSNDGGIDRPEKAEARTIVHSPPDIQMVATVIWPEDQAVSAKGLDRVRVAEKATAERAQRDARLQADHERFQALLPLMEVATTREAWRALRLEHLLAHGMNPQGADAQSMRESQGACLGHPAGRT